MNIEINQPCDLVIFGAKGDLSRRKLLPALYKLEKYKKIHKNTRIFSTGRAQWNKKEYTKIVKNNLINFINEKIDCDVWKKFSSRLFFYNLDIDQHAHFFQLKNILNQEKNIKIYYCAVPPNMLNSIFTGLKITNLNAFPSRIILEKPLGSCLKTSKKIHDQISQYFLESQIFRIDHYLGKESIMNLFALRFSNIFGDENWNNKTIDHVQITVSEEVGIENRWNYFDQIGQMRDMVQNHLLQILTIVAMNRPNSINPEDIRREKIKILSCLQPINAKNVHVNTVRGQYISGNVKGKKVVSYIEELGADQNSKTETFIAMKININNKQWSNVPFYLRTGKRLAHKYSEIVIFFKKIPINLFHKCNHVILQNKLIIRLEPHESIKLDIFSKIPGLDEEYKLKTSQLKCNFFNTHHNVVDAYEKLLLESMRGIQSFFVCREEVEMSWSWIDPIIEAWRNMQNNSFQKYVSGSWGPEYSDLLLLRDNRYWHQFNELI